RSAKKYPAEGYDLVCFFDCLHDMGDPVGATSHVPQTTAADGTCMLIRPFANDRLEDNLNPVGRIYYTASTMICTPASLDQEGGLAPGAQAGHAAARGGGAGTRRPGRRGAAARGCPPGRIFALPPRGRDAVQFDFGGAGLNTVLT